MKYSGIALYIIHLILNFVNRFGESWINLSEKASDFSDAFFVYSAHVYPNEHIRLAAVGEGGIGDQACRDLLVLHLFQTGIQL